MSVTVAGAGLGVELALVTALCFVHVDMHFPHKHVFCLWKLFHAFLWAAALVIEF